MRPHKPLILVRIPIDAPVGTGSSSEIFPTFRSGLMPLLSEIGPLLWISGVSEVIAIMLIVRVWRSNIGTFEKLALSLLALVPVLGLFLAWWLFHDPSPMPPHLRNYGPRGSVLHKWLAARDIFGSEKAKPAARERPSDEA